MNTPPALSLTSQPHSRRRVLAGLALGAAGLISGCRTTHRDQAKGLIDAHVHVWTSDLERYPIHPPYRVDDMQPASFTPEQFLAHAHPSGIRRAVLIQMSFYGVDNRYMLESMRRFPGVFSGVAVVDEHAPELSGMVRTLRTAGVRGFRIHPGPKGVAVWMDSAGMARLWASGADQGLALCPLINAAALPALDRMCQRYPRTRVVIDHFARIGTDGRMRQEEVDALCRLARHRHTYVKLSAFYALGKKKPPYTDLAPMIRHLRDTFGAQRLMWASDCPYQVEPGHSYAESIALIRDRLEFLSSQEKDFILRGTADKVFFS